ncbi:MAG: hypothetical protein Q9185_002536 [Variospora sp. 1 TL-2023]
MPILEANSEAFLNIIKSLQKGKGKSHGSLNLPESVTQRLFTVNDWKTEATVTKDVDAASPPFEEPVTSGPVKPIDESATAPLDNPPEPKDKATEADFQGVGATSPALAAYAPAHGHFEPNEQFGTDNSFEQTHLQNVPFDQYTPPSPEPILSADPLPNDYANNYATSSTDPAISELQITTRSMTTSGAATTQAETSACTEKPPSSRFPSPSPEASTPAPPPVWPPGLLSSGAEFLKALPHAGGAFKSRIRGGQEREGGTALVAASDHYQYAANDNQEEIEPKQQPHSLHPPRTEEPPEWTPMGAFTHPLPTNSGFPNPSATHPHNPSPSPFEPGHNFSDMWGIPKQDPSTLPTNGVHGNLATPANDPPPSPKPRHDFSDMWGIKSARRYTVAELRRLGLESQRALFENLLAMQGSGRVRVGVVRE